MKSVKLFDLLLALAVLVPAIALVLAAAHMGDGVDEAAIDQAQRIGGEAGRNGHAVGAVAIEQEGRRAVELRLLAIEQRHRDRLAVLRRRHDAARDVERWIVAARNFLSLAKLSLPRVHIVVEDLRRRRHRRIGEAQTRRVVLVAVRDAERIGLLGEGDGVLFAVGEAPHDDARQSILALEPSRESPYRRRRRESAVRACAARSPANARGRARRPAPRRYDNPRRHLNSSG